MIFLMLTKSILMKFPIITASGGGSRDSLLQFISDLSGQIIRRPKIRDKTALGVYRILNSNYNYKIQDEDKFFKPSKERDKISLKIKQWTEIISSLK